ncbi:hypothetical protein HPB49_015530 [Dermacentor silvarum]|uniref:Uncharacterized protein n=1 Tax=Dermacentor silvarum TaxID=543639 RepID=A0ACB8CFT8_DERSI|nr:hypothetical protein HPB49_015530 [Dermacentor silvarum]
MMYKQSELKINVECGDLNAAAVEIPYKGGKTSMVILLPHEVDGLPQLEAALTPSKLLDIVGGLETHVVELSLPRFKIELSVDIKNVLQSMGVQDLFSHKADLSGIGGKKDLVVSAALHKAFVEVNEEAPFIVRGVGSGCCSLYVMANTLDAAFAGVPGLQQPPSFDFADLSAWSTWIKQFEDYVYIRYRTAQSYQ